jgi:hypothetical protein
MIIQAREVEVSKKFLYPCGLEPYVSSHLLKDHISGFKF